MSVVAIKVTDTEIVIGADSIRVRGTTQEKDQFAKLAEVRPGFIIGNVGESQGGFLLRTYAATHIPRATDEEAVLSWLHECAGWLHQQNEYDKPKITGGQNSFLIVFGEKAFYSHNYYVREVLDFFAIGAGMDYALAALHLGRSVEEAIDCACELSIYCEKPVNIMRVPRE